LGENRRWGKGPPIGHANTRKKKGKQLRAPDALQKNMRQIIIEQRRAKKKKQLRSHDNNPAQQQGREIGRDKKRK